MRAYRTSGCAAICLFAILALVACSKPAPPASGSEPPPSVQQAIKEQAIEAPPAEETVAEEQAAPQKYRETGDLKALKKRGTIRFVTVSLYEQDQLNQSDVVTQNHNELAREFAKRLRLEPIWLYTETAEQAIEMVENGYADIITDNLTETPARQKRISFSEPLDQVRETLVTGSKGPDISAEDKLHDITFVVIAGSTYVGTAQRLIKKYPDANLKLKKVKPDEKVETMLDTVNEFPNTVTILDSNVVAGARQYRDDIRVGTPVTKNQNIAWGFRRDSEQLGRRLNNFLTRTLVKPLKRRVADWPEIKKSGVLRLLTYNGPTGYFLWKGVLMGFDYELAKAFAKQHNLQLQVIAVPFDHSLIQWLKEGRGDIAGAFSTFTPERKEQGVAFSVPYAEMAEQILSNSDKPPIKDPRDLRGRTLTLRAFSPFSASAHALKDADLGVKIEIAPPDVSYLELISMVASGKLDATIMDASTTQIEAVLRPELVAGMQTSDPRPKGWMMLPQNWRLQREINKFIKKFRQSDDYKRISKIYLQPESRYLNRMQARIIPGADLSPFDSLVKSYSSRFKFDWRLVVAQMWQESSFNPRAVSPVGAQGLLQVMPRTAQDMGVPPPLFEPERGIKAGVRYLNWVRDRFPTNIQLNNKLWFTLASYNAGYGHLLDAQQLARRLDLDPNVWFGNVEVAMLKLSDPEYFKHARYGYVRGAEPVNYVRNIRNLYEAYTDVVSGDVAVRPPLRPPEPEDKSAGGGKAAHARHEERQ
ncbi:transporter substrate-binding domain-containing protein [Microbulbifer sp. SAOS-129_SWC]|uniref:transporter substrate-binding domain-containing protein n=1 Tax=Microbulbifer sp. SAOS-129_SWC TaxID=3145235 RepID=UPI0032174088